MKLHLINMSTLSRRHWFFYGLRIASLVALISFMPSIDKQFTIFECND